MSGVPKVDGVLVAQATKRTRYFRGQVWPRRRELFFSWRFLLPFMLAGSLVVSLRLTTTLVVPIQDVASLGLNYSALAFGACVTGAVLAIGLPSEDRIRRWTATTDPVTGYSQYGKLVFATTWAAVSQLMVLLVSSLGLVIGNKTAILPVNALVTHSVLLALSLGVFLYAVLQLLILLSTVSQLGNLIDFETRHGAPAVPKQAPLKER